MTNMEKGIKCKVSVIVPVYRVEKYISRCMKSLLKQTLSEIEIICICEKEDMSYRILLDYEKSDNRVHVIEKRNVGVSSARNAGLKAAKGKYIAFVDADDWIEKYTLKELYLTAEKYNAQIIAYGIWPTVEPKGSKRNIFGFSPKRNVLYCGNGMKALVYEHGSRPFIGNKFYNRRFLSDHHIFFDESLDIGEDQMFQFEAFGVAEKICFIKDKLYHYNIERNNSAMNMCGRRHDAEDKNFRLLEAIMSGRKKLYGEKYEREYISWMLENYGWAVNRSASQSEKKWEERIIIIQKYLTELLFDENKDDLIKEYQRIGNKFMNYGSMGNVYEIMQMPSYKEHDQYMEMQVAGVYERISVCRGNVAKLQRVSEFFSFHEFRHLAVRILFKLRME